MCVIIYKPAGVEIEENLLSQCFDKNKDGAGFAFNVKGNMVSEKGFFDFEPLFDKVKKMKAYEGVVHCRIATFGPVSKFFCHPFPVKQSYLFHNGSISNLGSKQNSDTYVLSLILKNQNSKQRYSMLKDLSVSNRFCVMTPYEVRLFGKWIDYEGLTFSNMYWKPAKISKKQLVKCMHCRELNLATKFLCAGCGTILF